MAPSLFVVFLRPVIVAYGNTYYPAKNGKKITKTYPYVATCFRLSSRFKTFHNLTDKLFKKQN